MCHRGRSSTHSSPSPKTVLLPGVVRSPWESAFGCLCCRRGKQVVRGLQCDALQCLCGDLSPRHEGGNSREIERAAESRSLSRRGKRCSDVMPDGPPAAPRLDIRRQMRNSSSSKSNVTSGSLRAISWLNSCHGKGGRRSGLVSSLDVVSVLGATSAPSRETRAADNSPIWTNDRALLASFFPRCQLDCAFSWMMLGGHMLRLFDSPPRASTAIHLGNKWPSPPTSFQAPFLPGMADAARVWASLGKSMNNFHPLVTRESLPCLCPVVPSSKAVLSADLNASFKMNGMVLKR